MTELPMTNKAAHIAMTGPSKNHSAEDHALAELHVELEKLKVCHMPLFTECVNAIGNPPQNVQLGGAVEQGAGTIPRCRGQTPQNARRPRA